MAKVHIDGSNDSDFCITVSQKDDDKVLLSLIGKEFMDGIGEVFITVSDPKTFDVRVLLQNALKEADKVYEELNKPKPPELVDLTKFDDLSDALFHLKENAQSYRNRVEEARDTFNQEKEDAHDDFLYHVQNSLVEARKMFDGTVLVLDLSIKNHLNLHNHMVGLLEVLVEAPPEPEDDPDVVDYRDLHEELDIALSRVNC